MARLVPHHPREVFPSPNDERGRYRFTGYRRWVGPTAGGWAFTGGCDVHGRAGTVDPRACYAAPFWPALAGNGEDPDEPPQPPPPGDRAAHVEEQVVHVELAGTRHQLE